MGRPLIDLTGKSFGLWSVVERDGDGLPARWICVCECGARRSIQGGSLRSGTSKGCHSCRVKDNGGKAKHGHNRKATGKSPTYSTWASMIGRCYTPSATGYKWYGKQGIEVCERWRDFRNFLADMGERPPGTEIDRIDSRGHYEPGNCRWITHKENINNPTNARYGSVL